MVWRALVTLQIKKQSCTLNALSGPLGSGSKRSHESPTRSWSNKTAQNTDTKLVVAISRKESRTNIVYSTDPNFDEETRPVSETKAVPACEQNLRVQLDRKGRKGKSVTLVTGFRGPEADLKELGRLLRTACGAGGRAKNDEILIQGDFRAKIVNLLLERGYKVKRSGG